MPAINPMEHGLDFQGPGYIFGFVLLSVTQLSYLNSLLGLPKMLASFSRLNEAQTHTRREWLEMFACCSSKARTIDFTGSSWRLLYQSHMSLMVRSPEPHSQTSNDQNLCRSMWILCPFRICPSTGPIMLPINLTRPKNGKVIQQKEVQTPRSSLRLDIQALNPIPYLTT